MTDGGMAANDHRTHDGSSAVDDSDDIISVGGDTAVCTSSGRITKLAPGGSAVVVIETRDEHFRRAMTELGWTPPAPKRPSAADLGFEDDVRPPRTRSSFPRTHHVEGHNFVD